MNKIEMKKMTMVLIVMFLGFGLFGCKNETSGIERMKRYSGVTIPTDAIEIYNAVDNSFGAQGHGSQYTIFKFNEEPVNFFTSYYEYGGELYYTSATGEKYYREEIKGNLDFIDDELSSTDIDDIKRRIEIFKVPQDFICDFDDDYKYCIYGLNIFIYFKTEKTLLYYYKGY